MKIEFETNYWIDIRIDEDNTLIIEGRDTNANEFVIFSNNQRHIKQFIKDIKELKE